MAKPGARTIFSASEEQLIVNYIKYMSECQLPITRRHVFDIANKILHDETNSGLQRRSGQKIENVGEKWLTVRHLLAVNII